MNNTRPGFHPSLEALRGLAAMMVAMFHIGQTKLNVNNAQTNLFSDSAGGIFLRILGNGDGAVIFFFVLSGFVLSLQLQRSASCWPKTSVVFLAGRSLRILPSVVTTVALFAAVFFLTGRGLVTAPQFYEPLAVIQNALLLRTEINGVTWTLQVEMLAAPIILALFFASSRWGALFLLAALTLLIALSFAGAWTKLVSPEPILKPMYSFVVGMLAWKFSEATPRPRVLLAFAATCFICARPLLGWGSNWSAIVEALAAGAMICGLASNRKLGQNLGLENGLLRYYGRISYSFYLLHPLTLIAIWNSSEALSAAATYIPSTVILLGLFVGSVVLITPLAHFQYATVERLGISIGRVLSLMAFSTPPQASKVR